MSCGQRHIGCHVACERYKNFRIPFDLKGGETMKNIPYKEHLSDSINRIEKRRRVR